VSNSGGAVLTDEAAREFLILPGSFEQ